MALSSLGIGSGLDIRGMVDQLLAAEAAGPVSRLDRQESVIRAKLSAMGRFKGALSGLQSAYAAVSDFSGFTKKSAILSDSTYLSVSSSDSAAEGSYNVTVNKLAQAQKLASQGFAALDTTVSTGTLVIDFGTDNGDTTFTANPDKTSLSIDIDATNNTISGVRDAINAAGSDVGASIVFDGTDYTLVLTSKDTGAVNSMQVSGIAELEYNVAGTGNMTENAVAQDAEVVIDGITVTDSDNTISDALEGLTLSLKEADVAKTTTITVSTSNSVGVTAIKEFVAGYNDFMKTVTSVAGYDDETGIGSALLGDATVRSTVSQVQRIISTPVEGLTGAYRFMGDLGIATQSDGTLSIDESKLTEALNADPVSVSKIFAAGATSSDSLIKYVDHSDDTMTGEYALDISFYSGPTPATSAVYTNAAIAAAFPFSIGGNGYTFRVTIDGTQTAVLTMPIQSYADEAEVASVINGLINTDPAITGAGVSATVAAVGGSIQITSNSTGAGSTVSVDSASLNMGTNLGFTVGSAAGVDEVLDTTITGTLGGTAFTFDGQYIVGAGDAEGLRLEYLGGGTGARGTISFSRGMISTLDDMVSSYLLSDGVLTSREEILNDGLADIELRRDALDERLMALEARYLEKFSAMDTLVAQLQSTSQWLTQQLASLPKPNSIRN